MSPDEERWAEALALECIHGDDAPRWVAEQIGMHILVEDHAAVARFKEIAVRLQQLMRGADQ